MKGHRAVQSMGTQNNSEPKECFTENEFQFLRKVQLKYVANQIKSIKYTRDETNSTTFNTLGVR